MKGFLCDTNPIAIDYHSKKEVVKKILVVLLKHLPTARLATHY
jgi:hypothetical protein